MYTVEISIEHSNFPDYMHFTLLKVENEISEKWKK